MFEVFLEISLLIQVDTKVFGILCRINCVASDGHGWDVWPPPCEDHELCFACIQFYSPFVAPLVD